MMRRHGDDGGYDRSLTMFSPEGRLYQVEYALEAVSRGGLCIGLKSKNGVVLVSHKRYKKLMDPASVQKIYKIDEHIGCAISGLHSDSRVLVDYARVQCQVHRLTYGEPVRVQTITRRLADIKQAYTQHGGVRPFGSSLLICGVDPDGTPRIMTTSPTGTYYAWKGKALGSESGEADKMLEERLKEDMSINELVKLGVDILRKITEEKEDNKIQLGIVSVEDRKLRILEGDDIKQFLK